MQNGHLNGHTNGDSATPPTLGEQAESLELRWATDPRYNGIRRDYTARDVIALRNSLKIEHSLAAHGAAKL